MSSPVSRSAASVRSAVRSQSPRSARAGPGSDIGDAASGRFQMADEYALDGVVHKDAG